MNQDNIAGIDQWQPFLACDEYTGQIAIVYYDSRDFTSNNNFYTYMSTSNDEGNTWSDVRLGDLPGQPMLTLYSHDYNGIDMYNGMTVPVWTDMRYGMGRTYAEIIENPCIVDLQICGPTTPYYKLERASNSITAASNSCDYQIPSTASIKFKAENYIHLNSGFSASYGSSFGAKIIQTCDVSTGFRLASALSNHNNDQNLETGNMLKTEILHSVTSDDVGIRLYSSIDCKIKMRLLDVNGNLIQVLVNNFDLAAKNQTSIYYSMKSMNLSSGIYLISIEGCNHHQVERICYIQE